MERELIKLLEKVWYFDHDGLDDLFSILIFVSQNSNCARLMLREIDLYKNVDCDFKSIVFLVSRLMEKMSLSDSNELLDDIKMISL